MSKIQDITGIDWIEAIEVGDSYFDTMIDMHGNNIEIFKFELFWNINKGTYFIPLRISKTLLNDRKALRNVLLDTVERQCKKCKVIPTREPINIAP